MSRRPSPHFAWSEFDVDHRAPLPASDRPAYARLCCAYLEPLRARFGPVTVHSSRRTPDYNRRVGGAPGSLHLTTSPASVAAADVSCARGTPTQWYRLLDELGVGGLGLYDDHVHADTRRVHARW